MSPLSPAPVRRSSRNAPWTDAEAAHVLAAAQASGLSLYRFARQHGLGVTQLYWWRERLARRQAAAELTPLVFVPVVAAETAANAFGSGVELAVGAVTVRIAPDFCSETLQRLLPLLVQAQSC